MVGCRSWQKEADVSSSVIFLLALRSRNMGHGDHLLVPHCRTTARALTPSVARKASGNAFVFYSSYLPLARLATVLLGVWARADPAIPP